MKPKFPDYPTQLQEIRANVCGCVGRGVVNAFTACHRILRLTKATKATKRGSIADWANDGRRGQPNSDVAAFGRLCCLSSSLAKAGHCRRPLPFAL